ncbi:TetR/AcrR family transcriptional regulator [Actinoplanes sp. NBRC 101535]|uniref:TetR/AcrR family transcriptional regulator n=1 Tax=Actinoplanes sp. NBRC 101535 TaxID=3032196 RepID=UPI0024A078F8|nr:TetR/AcrR family transcriptional regulator [Actinoplanes sp. NBRC 101535]GLY05446.1 TetR family transcriptional regulator [Actinoplanes sp. NBRC 101535]
MTRNASQTRHRLLAVARHHFARQGYATTTVRDIADGAGVNVALISRYFTSKEGLFEECLRTTVTDFKAAAQGMVFADVAEALAHRLTSPTGDPALLEGLLLLIRSSGDERADTMRRTLLCAMSSRLAVSAGAAEPPDTEALLRAQLVLAAALGIAMMRANLDLEPLATATEAEMLDPLHALVATVIP